MRQLMPVSDQVGLGWRGELAGDILRHLDKIDALEVIAEDWLSRGPKDWQGLELLGSERPLLLHGVCLGLASSHEVERKRLECMARLCERVKPAAWSEHLAFVRAGSVEIGHLAAPPRTEATIEGAIRNLTLASRIVGQAPVMENIATLIDPPGSTLREGPWITSILETCDGGLLLDLHNLYANALNFGDDPRQLLTTLPVGRVSIVHLSGGRWLHCDPQRPRLLDDHLHDPPDEVYGLLQTLAQLAPQPLTVIIERDGNYPAFDTILAQIGRARGALRRGRSLSPVRQVA